MLIGFPSIEDEHNIVPCDTVSVKFTSALCEACKSSRNCAPCVVDKLHCSGGKQRAHQPSRTAASLSTASPCHSSGFQFPTLHSTATENVHAHAHCQVHAHKLKQDLYHSAYNVP